MGKKKQGQANEEATMNDLLFTLSLIKHGTLTNTKVYMQYGT